MERVDAIIAGVNKAGTTSLFVSLAEHPDVVASAIKETRYFLPARYGHPLEPPPVWERYFAAHPERPVRLEATPSYFYGGADVAHALSAALANPRVLLVLREPVARAVSFFEYQKVRLRFPPETTIEQYLAEADALGDRVGAEADTEKYMAVRGGCYADWLPAWWDGLGRDAVQLVWFEDLVGDDGAAVVRDVANVARAGSCAAPDHRSALGEPHHRLQARAPPTARALGQRHRRALVAPRAGFKRWLRSLYFRINGRARPAPAVAATTRASSRGASTNRTPGSRRCSTAPASLGLRGCVEAMRADEPSRTARGVAIARAQVERIPWPTGDVEADDRLARIVIGDGADAFRREIDAARRVRRGPDIFRWVDVRTRFFDRVVTGALTAGIGQVVSLGAGYDGRAVRYRTPGVRYFEVDHPATQNDKRARYDAADVSTEGITFVAADFATGDLDDALARGRS